MTTYRERRERRLEKLDEWAEKNQSIYADDADAIDRLAERIEKLEQERGRVKEINAYFRRHKIDMLNNDDETNRIALHQAHEALGLTTAEFKDLAEALRFSRWGKGYPPFHLQNLGGNINRQKKRLAKLQADAKSRKAQATAERHTVTLTAQAADMGDASGNQRWWWVRNELAGEFLDMPEDCPGNQDLSVTMDLPDGRYFLGCGSRKHGARITFWIRDGEVLGL